jgi:tryptophan synthase alpha chain
MKGLTHIAKAFATTSEQGRAALMPYFTLGFPDPETSLEVVQAISSAGADLIELGIPFSDPLADGPTIQRSTQVALEQGMTVQRCLEMSASLRHRGVHQPLLLMGYYNPILAYGVERFAEEAAAAGVDGFIVPDLPPDEAARLQQACRAREMALVFLLAPTTTPQRVAAVASQTSGFLYLVSLTGVTGERSSLPANLQSFIKQARRATKTPLAVGFGISTPEQAQAVGEMADGVIVGSALVRVAAEASHPAQAAGAFVARLRQALEPTPPGLSSVLPEADPRTHGFLGC